VKLLTLIACALVLGGCGKRDGTTQQLRVFHAAGLTPVIDALRADCARDLGIEILAEGSGSQVACRKLTELGRDCDLIMLADSGLVAELLPGRCSWRLDFAGDEIVLGVGLRAPYADLAEQDWPAVLQREDVRLGRVDENQGPIGYRTLLVWRLAEMGGVAGLYDALLARTQVVVDDVARLTPLLRTGEIDYGFVYRSICVASDIRSIPLDPAVNLGSPDHDYSAAVVTYEKLKAGEPEKVTVRGAPVTWALSIPDAGADAALAARFVRYMLLERPELLELHGFRPGRPAAFYGLREAFGPFGDYARYAGGLR
jgi:molybdate/tungstate transport system substrate-binding protein